MTNVLLSIKPRYVEKILAGSKQVEFRRRIWKNRDIKYVYIYVSAPVKCVIGRFKVKHYTRAHVVKLWDNFSAVSGVSEEEFYKYFEDLLLGYALEISDLEVFKVPVSLKWFLFGSSVPQNFRYLTPHEKYVLQWCSQDESASILKRMMELGEGIFFEKLQTMGVLKVE